LDIAFKVKIDPLPNEINLEMIKEIIWRIIPQTYNESNDDDDNKFNFYDKTGKKYFLGFCHTPLFIKYHTLEE